MPLGAIPSIIYTFGTNTTRRSALLTDILALSFSHNALSLLKLDSFKTGCVLLSGLFFYDIWWVFGTEVVSTFLLAPDSSYAVLYRDVNSLKPKLHLPFHMQSCMLPISIPYLALRWKGAHVCLSSFLSSYSKSSSRWSKSRQRSTYPSNSSGQSLSHSPPNEDSRCSV